MTESQSMRSSFALIAGSYFLGVTIAVTLLFAYANNIPSPLGLATLWVACAAVAITGYLLMKSPASKLKQGIALATGSTFLAVAGHFSILPFVAWARLPASAQSGEMFGMQALAGSNDVATYISLCVSAFVLTVISLVLVVGATRNIALQGLNPQPAST